MAQPRTVTREELYKLVWETPMVRLAEEFGVSGNGLAKACRRLNVPYPSLGYWAKKEAGKPVSVTKLPRALLHTPTSTEIHPTPARPPKMEPPPPDPIALVASEAAANILVPDAATKLHPLVQKWLAEHNEEQRENARKRKEHRWFQREMPDLTERDLYRFRVTSAIFYGVEKAGGKIVRAPITGKIVFASAGQEVACSIVEKMAKSLKPRDLVGNWTAYPDHHNSSLGSTGFLRVSITSWLDGRKPEWVESSTVKIGDLLPKIVGEIVAAGHTLEQIELRRREDARRHQMERERLEAIRAQRELDDKR